MSFAVAAIAYVANDYVQTQKEGVANQKRAMDTAEARARKNELLQEQDMNKQNQKKPDIFGLLRANQLAGSVGGTNMTGPGGIDPNSMKLGKTTLLGL
jgi:hypothetical protein